MIHVGLDRRLDIVARAAKPRSSGWARTAGGLRGRRGFRRGGGRGGASGAVGVAIAASGNGFRPLAGCGFGPCFVVLPGAVGSALTVGDRAGAVFAALPPARLRVAVGGSLCIWACMGLDQVGFCYVRDSSVLRAGSRPASVRLPAGESGPCGGFRRGLGGGGTVSRTRLTVWSRHCLAFDLSSKIIDLGVSAPKLLSDPT
jgi:hypothetical protein